MLARLGRLYARRIVNVNVNVIVAGVLALVPTLFAVHYTHTTGFHLPRPARLGIKPEWIITAVTFLADVLSDVVIYYALHWLANHWPAMLHLRREARNTPRLTFFRDATLVQVERAALSPLLYFIFLGTQHVLVRYQVAPVTATIIGFVGAILVARTLHTIWMLWCESKRPQAAAIPPDADQPPGSIPIPPPAPPRELPKIAADR